MEQYDAVIAGAGPAGAQCARDLAGRGYDVIVLEREAESSFPRMSNKSTGGTFPRMLSSFSIPDEVVMRFTDDVVLESPSDYYVIEQPGAVLEFANFKEFLVEDGRDRGAEYEFDAMVSGVVEEDGSPVGVEYNRDKVVYGEVLIDATGPAAALASDLGVAELDRDNQAIGIEYEFEGVELDHPECADLSRAMMLRLDEEYAPGGYAWIFATGENRAKVGVTYINNDRFKQNGDEDLTIDEYLDRFVESDPRLESAEPIDGEHHRGSAHIQPPESMTTDSFIAIGDTVPTIDPLWGEGIHKGMKSARAAATTVDQALTGSTQDTGAEAMQLYEKLWHRDVAPQAERRLLMTKLMYFAPNDRYDQLMADLKRLDLDTLADANKGSPLAMARLFHLSDLPMLAGFVRSEYAAESSTVVGSLSSRPALNSFW